MIPDPPVPEIALVPLDPDRDATIAQSIFEACADYALLESGLPPSPEAARDFFAETAPGLAPEAMLKLGLVEEGRAVGLADIARGYPDPESWYIGLLMIAPGARSRQVGTAAVERIAAMARVANATRLLVCVFDENPRAQHFWQARGFTPLRPLAPRAFGAKMHARLELACELAPSA